MVLTLVGAEDREQHIRNHGKSSDRNGIVRVNGVEQLDEVGVFWQNLPMRRGQFTNTIGDRLAAGIGRNGL